MLLKSKSTYHWHLLGHLSYPNASPQFNTFTKKPEAGILLYFLTHFLHYYLLGCLDCINHATPSAIFDHCQCRERAQHDCECFASPVFCPSNY
ncbi:hypothetical protein AMATHDRAFT_68903 [Amanita thiersii Skay4041]|uniref:Uncharacterized protein n=1 Tax=Amanita thiersii Skay4041 TaxID=703135 RepID=A0A2A9N9W6_9AGAR|nr:hypothetical protein AMATHDRAFT_68903 [Amanita thiersii Skay4041]